MSNVLRSRVITLTKNEGYKELKPGDLLKLQRESYQWFIEEGLPKIFEEVFPIEVPTGKDGRFVLEYVDHRFGELSEENPFEAKKNQKTYSRPLYLTLRLRIKPSEEDPEIIKEGEVLLCDLPMMTDRGTFIFNGTERVYVNQLIKSPGVYRSKDDQGSKITFRTSLSAIRGAPVELETDVRKPLTVAEEHLLDPLPTSLLRFRIERTKSKRRKVSATLFLRGMGYTYSDIIRELVFEYIKETEREFFNRDFEYTESDLRTAEQYLMTGNVEMFILETPSIQQVMERRPNLKAVIQILANTLKRDVEVDKVLVTTSVDKEQRAQDERNKALKILYTKLVDEATRYVPTDVMSQQVFVFFDPERYDISLAGRYKLLKAFNRKVKCHNCGHEEIPKSKKCSNCGTPFNFDTVLTERDFLDLVKYHMKFLEGFGHEDDLDHLGNRKLRRVGEQLYNQFKAGMIRLSRVVRERFMIAFGSQENVSDKVNKALSFIDEALSAIKIYSKDEGDEGSSGEEFLAPLGNAAELLRKASDIIAKLRNREVREQASKIRTQLKRLADRLEKSISSYEPGDSLDKLLKTISHIADDVSEVLREIDKYEVIAKAIEVNISEVFTNRPVVGAIKQFFAQQSQLSQFLDQTNPLAELTHKRRISALGPGGLHKERAGYEVRDVKATHYGRICPIETPEGSNIGLITSLAILADSNDFDFLVTPYYPVKNGKVNFNVVEYLDADDETKYVIAPADVELDEDGNIVPEYVMARRGGEPQIVRREEVNYIDVSPRQIFSLSASLIPFIENDDANRALMGANMQRQAVPLVETEAPLIMTGMERIAAESSGFLVKAKRAGVVKYVDARRIVIVTDDGDEDVYELIKFTRSNAGTLLHQVPIVNVGDKVEEGQAIASGPAMDGDVLALGRNVLVAFLPWEGYNFEDAIVISEELVREHMYDSVHVEDFDSKAVRTKLGKEEITREIPGVPEEELKHLNDDGVVIPGTWVKPGSILVGKLTPEGESELSPEEKLLRAIFGEQAKKAKDTSLRVPPGLRGKVMEVHSIEPSQTDPFSENSNLLKMIMVYVAQYRPLQVGDKMAGRHGNKGVISKILPVEDMPFLADGTPVQMVLNPLGVPSRMNVGQIMETHLGLVCKLLGIRMEVPSFYKMTEEEIRDWLRKALEKELMDTMGDTKRAYSSKEVLLLTMKRSGYTIEHVLDLLGFTREKLIERLIQAGYTRAELDRYPDEELKKLIVLDDLTEDEHKQAINKILENLLDGKFVLYDGKTGEPFKQPVIVGYMYMMKLIHLAEEKIHARSTGPYSLVTQQPLGGKAQFGGQRFGEMEVWALEAYGASHALQEMLTIKSDDITGRYKAYEAIIKDENIKLVTIPESFKVLIKELQALAMNVEIITKDDQKIIPRDYEAFEPEEEALMMTPRI